MQGLWNNKERLTKAIMLLWCYIPFNPPKLLPCHWAQRGSWHLLTRVIKDHTSVLYTTHQSSLWSLQECHYSHCLNTSVTLMPDLLVQHLQQQHIELPCSCKLTWMMLTLQHSQPIAPHYIVHYSLEHMNFPICTLQSHLFRKLTALFCPLSCFWNRCCLNLVCMLAIDLVAGKSCLSSSSERDCFDFSFDRYNLIVFSISWYSIMSGSVNIDTD